MFCSVDPRKWNIFLWRRNDVINILNKNFTSINIFFVRQFIYGRIKSWKFSYYIFSWQNTGWKNRNAFQKKVTLRSSRETASTPYVCWVCCCFPPLLREVFLRGTLVFPSPQKPTLPNSNSTRNQVDEEPLCGCATFKSLFISSLLYHPILSVITE